MRSLKDEQEKEEKFNELKIFLVEFIETKHFQENLLKASENMNIEFVDSIKRK